MGAIQKWYSWLKWAKMSGMEGVEEGQAHWSYMSDLQIGDMINMCKIAIQGTHGHVV